MAGGATNNEGRVTTREFYDALQTMERRVVDRLDTITACLPAMENQVKTNTKEIDTLRKRSNYWDAGNTLGLLIAGVLSAIGINK